MRIPSTISLDKEGQYCLKCFASAIEQIKRGELTYYHCSACGKTSERSLVIDNKIVWWVDQETREYWHESVGIFIFDNKDRILLFKRVIYPFAFTIPAGHLDAEEDPARAVLRELREETGIEIDSTRLFCQEDIAGDQCRRGAGSHRWHLYTARVEDVGRVEINSEGNQPVWLNIEEALTHKLVYPVEYFLKKYGSNLLN